jgi:hypothetical protein
VDLFQVPKLRRDNVFRTQARPKVIGLAEEPKVEAFETLEIFQVREKLKAQEEEHRQPLDQLQRRKSGPFESHVQTPRRARRRKHLSRRIWEHVDQQPLDPGNVHKV